MGKEVANVMYSFFRSLHQQGRAAQISRIRVKSFLFRIQALFGVIFQRFIVVEQNRGQCFLFIVDDVLSRTFSHKSAT